MLTRARLKRILKKVELELIKKVPVRLRDRLNRKMKKENIKLSL